MSNPNWMTKFKPAYKASRTIRLMLIDGNNIAWRSMYGGDLLTHPRTGENVGLLYRFLATLRMLMNRFPKYLPIVCWDCGRSKHKCAYYPEYKEDRKAKRVTRLVKSGRNEEAIDYHKEFIRQTKLLKTQALEYLGIPQVLQEGVEADDLIYFLTRQYAGKRGRILIASGDRDLWQCINERVMVFDPNTKSMVNTKTFEHMTKEKAGKKMLDGIPHRQWKLYRALTGDSSDNIDGVRGIGPGKARDILYNNPWVNSIKTLRGCVDGKGKQINALLERMDADVGVVEQLRKSHRMQDLSYWYKKHYAKELKGKWHPRYWSVNFYLYDQQAFEKWAFKQHFRSLENLSLLSERLHKRWKLFFHWFKQGKNLTRKMK